jgi:hydroxylamine reductase
MANDMFCFQCEQTAKGTGCTGCAGVCGKTAEVSNLQDALTDALIHLAGAVKEPSEQAVRVMIDGLFATITNVNFDAEDIHAFIEKAKSEAALAGGDAASVSDGSEPL